MIQTRRNLWDFHYWIVFRSRRTSSSRIPSAYAPAYRNCKFRWNGPPKGEKKKIGEKCQLTRLGTQIRFRSFEFFALKCISFEKSKFVRNEIRWFAFKVVPIIRAYFGVNIQIESFRVLRCHYFYVQFLIVLFNSSIFYCWTMHCF